MSNKSLAHATAIAVIYLVVALFVVTSIQAQPPCSTGATTVTIKKLIQYNGVCCEVQFVVCYLQTGTTFEIVVQDAAVTDPDCWNLSPGAPPPFSEGYLMTVARDLIIRSTYPGTIPTCPTMAPLDIVFTSATCGEWATRVVDPDGPGGTPEVLERYISWCSDVACTRSCEVCVNPNDPDPCDDNKPRLYFQCAPYYNPGCPGVPLPTDCQNFCGS